MPAHEAQLAWASVAAATEEGRLGCTAKIANVPRDGKHVILIYADSFCDVDACGRLVGSIVGMGLQDCLRSGGFKACVFTFLDQAIVGHWRIHQDLACAANPAAAAAASELPTGRGLKPCKFGPSRANPAPRSLRRALLVPQVNTGALYRCGKRT